MKLSTTKLPHICMTAVAALLPVTAPQASAATPADPGAAATSNPGAGATSFRVTTTDPADAACVQVHRIDQAPVLPGDCAIVMTGGTEPFGLTGAERAIRRTDRPSGGAQLAATSALQCSTWWQAIKSGAGLWQEKHTGKYCWNGKDVWIWAKGGYHRCDQGYGIGYDIKVTACSEEKVAYAKTYFRQNWDYFKVYFMYQGFPVNAAYNMHANVWPNGIVTYHNSL
jgi:hypothetical protein